MNVVGDGTGQMVSFFKNKKGFNSYILIKHVEKC
jgi:hypothetical protein